jgi:hypothetical protein
MGGIDKTGERNRLAVETTLHPISYTTYEGAYGHSLVCVLMTGGDGRSELMGAARSRQLMAVLPSGERCGTCESASGANGTNC